MELNVFLGELKQALINRGVAPEAAERHAGKLQQSFEADDLKEIEEMDSNDEIEALADSVALILKKRTPQATGYAEGMPEKTSIQNPIPVSSAETKNKSDKKSEDDEVFEFEEHEVATEKGKTVFLVGLILTLPITLALLIAIYGLFAGLFAAIVGLIVALVVGMIALIAGGAVCSLVGIVYGVTQLFSFVEAGIYEIGLGVTVAGIVLLLSVLIYNLAIRVVPILITKLAQFVGFVTKKIKELFFNIRRECYKL